MVMAILAMIKAIKVMVKALKNSDILNIISYEKNSIQYKPTHP